MTRALRPWLLSVLCLLGTFVYLTRDPVAPPAQAAPQHHGHAPGSGHSEADGGHGAHCVYCFSAAFAVEPPVGSGRIYAAQRVRRWIRRLAHLALRRAWGRQARAPPGHRTACRARPGDEGRRPFDRLTTP